MDIHATTSARSAAQPPLGPFAYLPEIASVGVLAFSVIYMLSLLYLGSYPETIIYGFYALYAGFAHLVLSNWLALVVIGAVLAGFGLIYVSKRRDISAILLALSLPFALLGGMLTLFASPDSIDYEIAGGHVYTLFYDRAFDGDEFYTFYECDRVSVFCYRIQRSDSGYFEKNPMLVVNNKNEAVSIVAGDAILFTYHPR